MWMQNFAACRDHVSVSVCYRIVHGCPACCVCHFRADPHLTIGLCRHSQVGKVGAGIGEQSHVAEDAHRSPVVVAVELITFEMGIHTQRQFLVATGTEIGGEVKLTGVVARLPAAHIMSVQPQVVAAEHPVESDAHMLPFP